ncbi:hypothetical protein ACLOJK_001029 [Asimina triloba]
MDSEFTKAVEAGLRLAKRIYCGKDPFVSAPKPLPAMDKAPSARPTYYPTAPMMYAVISDPGIVDNPDIPSYQPHVHGRCDPPALIPMQMTEIGMEVECDLDTAFVQLKGSWRVHCVMGSRSCDCRFAIPMGEQGSILGVEADVRGRLLSTQIVRMEETENMAKSEHSGLLDPQMFVLTIPEVDGGSVISIKVSWFQKLEYTDGHFSVSIPFSFPEYILPPGKRFATKERVQLTVNTSLGWEVMCKTVSHPMKELKRQAGKLRFLYEADVITWSSSDFHFSYTVPSNDIFGGLVLQSPSVDDFDQRGMFCVYLFPGTQNKKAFRKCLPKLVNLSGFKASILILIVHALTQDPVNVLPLEFLVMVEKWGKEVSPFLSNAVFRKEVIFLVDVSGSMRGKQLENAKNALMSALFKLTPEDSFGIIAFNGETHLFSSSLESATMEVLERATKWMSDNIVAGGDTNIMTPLSTAMEMFSTSSDSIPQIFLITDGAVVDERNICHFIKDRMIKRLFCPCISTFGIGKNFREEQVHFHLVRDTNCKCRCWGRYKGHFPVSLKAKGIFADMSSTTIELTVKKETDISLDKVFSNRQIDMLTAQAWFSESKQLEEKATNLSMRTGIASEYTRMVVIQMEKHKASKEATGGVATGPDSPSNNADPNPTPSLEGNSYMVVQAKKAVSGKKTASNESTKMLLLRGFSIGFGDIAATIENTTSAMEEKLTESDMVYVKTRRCCGRLTHCCCCCPCSVWTCAAPTTYAVLTSSDPS